MSFSRQLIVVLVLTTLIHARSMQAQTTKEHDNVTDAHSSDSYVDKFIKYAPGKYEHFDLLFLLDYQGLNSSSPPPDVCPNIMLLGNFSKVDDNAANLRFTQLVLEDMPCSATPSTPLDALRFIRIHLDMFFNPHPSPSPETHQDEMSYQTNPYQESIDRLRHFIDGNMFQWYTQIQPATIRCLPGIESVEEGSMFAIDARKFFSLLLDSIQSLASRRQPSSPQLDPRTLQESVQNFPSDSEQNNFNSTVSSTDTMPSSDVLKNMSGHYFFSYVSSNSSCLYVLQRDVQMLRDVMRAEERKAMREEAKGHFLKPGMTIAAASVCNCGDGYPRMVEIQVLNHTQLQKLQTRPFFGRFLTYVEAMLLSPGSWINEISHQAEGDGGDTEPVPTFIARFDGIDCGVSRVLALSDIVHKVERPSFENARPQNNTAKSKVREFAETAVILKYFQEITGKQGREIVDTIPIETMLEMASQMMLAADKVSQVLVLDAGSKCGSHIIEHDIVVLVEHRHIFEQLRHLPIFQLINSKFIERFLGLDDESRRFTIHILQDKDEGITSCSYASSEGAVALLSTQCQVYRALGTGGFRYRKNYTSEDDVPYPSKQAELGDDERGEENKPNGSETRHPENTGGDKSAAEKTTEEPEEPDTTPEFGDSPGPLTMSSSPSAVPSVSSDSSSGGNRGGGGGGMCFPADALTTLENGDVVPMTALQVGDVVADGTGGTSKILVFAHQDYLIQSEFVRIETAAGEIILSPSHYVYTHRGLMTAESVQVGDQIETVAEGYTGLAAVTKLSSETKVGLFNPITVSGSIAVAGSGNNTEWAPSKMTSFKASCFTSIVDVATSNTLVAPLRWSERYLGLSFQALSTMFKNGNHFWPPLLKRGAKHVSRFADNS